MTKRQQFVAKCIEHHGFNEADGSHRLIVDIYNKIRPLPVSYTLSYSDPWCAAYVSAMAKQCGLLDTVYPECSCERMIELYKKAGRWIEDDNHAAKSGELVFYSWSDLGNGDCTKPADHVGVVVSSSGVTMKIIEGNLSNAVQYRNLVVGARYIRGFACPDFEGEGKPDEDAPILGTKPEAEPAVQTCTVELPVLHKGMAVPGVRALQLLLIGAGCGVGPDGADGDFGNNTDKALEAFQKKRGLTPDKVAGKATWSALLK